MSKNKTNKPAESGLLEDSEVLAAQLSKTEEFVEKNKNLVTVISTVIVVAIAAYLFGNYYVDKQDKVAQADMFQAVYYFEADSLNLALNGDGNNLGFLDIIDEYSMTDAANLANYYTGVSYLRLEDAASALEYLKAFSASDYLVQSRAYSLIGDAHSELENYDQAAKYYEKAASNNANKSFSPVYLEKAAVANESAGNISDALDNYNTIVDDYFGADNYLNAQKHAARLNGLLQ